MEYDLAVVVVDDTLAFLGGGEPTSSGTAFVVPAAFELLFAFVVVFGGMVVLLLSLSLLLPSELLMLGSSDK